MWGKRGLQKFQQKLHNVSGYKNNEREHCQTGKQAGNAGTKTARDFLIWYLGIDQYNIQSYQQQHMHEKDINQCGNTIHSKQSENLPTKKIPSTGSFTGELFQILSEEVLPVLNKLFQKIEE